MNARFIDEGFKVVSVPDRMVKTKRSIKDRIFSLPWRPLKKFNIEWFSMMSDGEVVVDKERRVIYCNERTKLEIEKAVKA